MVNTKRTPIRWIDVKYNFVYILPTIFGAIFLSGESNVLSVLLKMF